jgi:inhibitor of cysteine peptidase
MKRMNKISLILLAGILLLAACAQAGAVNSTLNLTEKDAGHSFEIAKGGQVIVTLSGNITTGYTWEMAPAGNQILIQIGEADFKSSSNALGAGGEITLKFEAARTGSTQLKLIYHRPWEKAVSPIKTYEVTITVK